MHVLKGQQVKQGQELFTLRNAEKEMISEIAGGQAQHKNVAERIRKLDEKVRATSAYLVGSWEAEGGPLNGAAEGCSRMAGLHFLACSSAGGTSGCVVQLQHQKIAPCLHSQSHLPLHNTAVPDS